MRSVVIAAACMLVALPAGAQNDTLRNVPVGVDTLTVPADTVLVPADLVLAPADTLAAEEPPQRPRAPLVGALAPPVHGQVTGAPVRSATIAPENLYQAIPGVFVHALGTAFAPIGIRFGLTPPNKLRLRLDGRPADDIFSGRAALERLPEDLLGPLVAERLVQGSSIGIVAHRRAFAADVPITELRYRTGPLGHQVIGVTHAQTRRPGFAQRLGGDAARLAFHLHVGGHRSRGVFENSEVDGWNVEGRARLLLPGVTLGVTQRHHRRTEGAWGGVLEDAPSPFLATAPVTDPFAQREVINNDLAVEVRAALFSGMAPTDVNVFWTAATLRFESPQSIQSKADRFGIGVGQQLTFGGHSVELAADVQAGRVMGGDGLPPGALPLEVHLSVSDSIRVGSVGFHGAVGWHQSDDWSFPSALAGVRIRSGWIRLEGETYLAGSRFSPVEIHGFGDRIASLALTGETVMGAAIGVGVDAGDVIVSVRGEVQSRSDPRLLIVAPDGAGQMLTAEGRLDQALGIVEVGWRYSAMRGLYLNAWAAGSTTISDPPSPELLLEGHAHPDVWGHARLGARAGGLFSGALDLDIYVRVRGWTSYRGRVLHNETALLGLSTHERADIPARVVLDGVVEAGLGRGRATAFVTYENALSRIAYDGVYVVPLYPFGRPAVRAGIFWVIPN